MSRARQGPAKNRVRLELDQRRAVALHAALSEALLAELLVGDRHGAASEVLADLTRRAPGWLESAAQAGEAADLVAAEAVLRALVDAEEGRHARSGLAEPELLAALGDKKPLGVGAGEVLDRMCRERLIRRRQAAGEEPWFSATSAGRRFLRGDPGTRGVVETVREPLVLLDLLFADGRGDAAFLPWVQAVGRLADENLAPLVDALRAGELVDVPEPAEPGGDWLALTSAGEQLARKRWEHVSTGTTLADDWPERSPLPYRRELPVRFSRECRSHPAGEHGGDCTPVSWLHHSSTSRSWATLKRDGVVECRCRRCGGVFFVFLQAAAHDDRPVYRDLASATHNRPAWRLAGRRW